MFLRAGIQSVVLSSTSPSSSRSVVSSIIGILGSPLPSSNNPSLVTLQRQQQPEQKCFSSGYTPSLLHHGQVISPESLENYKTQHCQNIQNFKNDPFPDNFRSHTKRSWKWESHNSHLQPFLQQRRFYHCHFCPDPNLVIRMGSQVFQHPSARTYSSDKSSGSSGTTDPPKCKSDSLNEPRTTTPLSSLTINESLESRESATDFLNQLTEDQKQLIYHTLNIDILRDKYEGHLGSSRMESHHYLSKFGRPTTAQEDPTGTLCEVSPKWLHARMDEKAPPAPASAIWAVVVKNALPFVGFGFLDNLIMILAGDYIDLTIGTALGISTMAAAALGNTISDVAGIGSAWYVERFASKIGIKDPDLTPSQMASGAVRWACNLGRAFGVTIGCLLGMFPLLFLPSAEEKKEKELLKNQNKAILSEEDEQVVEKSKFA